MTSFALRVTRFAFGQLERLSPAVSGRLAFAIFCRTPRRRPQGTKARLAFREGRQHLENAQQHRLELAHGHVAAHVLGPQGQVAAGARIPRILVVHGWGSRAEYLVNLAAGLRSAGAEVTLLDLPGHGASSGRRLDLKCAAEAICAAQHQLGPFDGVVGHSFGGSAVMMAFGGNLVDPVKIGVPRIALIGSPSAIVEVFEDFARFVGLGPSSLAQMRRQAETLVGCTVEELDTVRAAARIDSRLLVVHAEDDKEVHAGHARRMIGASPQVRHLWANGHGHRRIISAPDVICAVADFLLRTD